MPNRKTNEILPIGAVLLKSAADGQNVIRANVDGAEISYASDIALAPNADALACAFLIPALASRRRLKTADAIDSELASNMRKIADICHDWWGYGPLDLEAEIVCRAAAGGTGMFFTAGVDSFYTLWRNRDRLDYLINIHGFDINLDDTDRFAKLSADIRSVADSIGKQAIFVRTNLREHPTFSEMNWEITHIAALASVGHLLAPTVQKVFVASSDVPPPYGSNPALDCLWSSSNLQVVNDEINVARLAKVRAISNWPLAQRYLKVCWENRAKTLNCGECEKCVRTQAQLEAVGALACFETFPSGSLAERIDALAPIHEDFVKQWRDIQDELNDAKLHAAIDGLLERSARLHKVDQSERKLWSALGKMNVTSAALRELDARYLGGNCRKLYYALMRLIHARAGSSGKE